MFGFGIRCSVWRDSVFGCWDSVLGFGVQFKTWFFASFGIRCWDSVLGFGVGIRFWGSVLVFGLGVRSSVFRVWGIHSKYYQPPTVIFVLHGHSKRLKSLNISKCLNSNSPSGTMQIAWVLVRKFEQKLSFEFGLGLGGLVQV